MKVRIDCNDDDYWYECESAPEIDLPDAIIQEWRALQAKLKEFDQYFEERARPLIDEAYRKKREEYERIHPPDPMTQRWARELFKQFTTEPLFVRFPK